MGAASSLFLFFQRRQPLPEEERSSLVFFYFLFQTRPNQQARNTIISVSSGFLAISIYKWSFHTFFRFPFVYAPLKRFRTNKKKKTRFFESFIVCKRTKSDKQAIQARENLSFLSFRPFRPFPFFSFLEERKRPSRTILLDRL